VELRLAIDVTPERTASCGLDAVAGERTPA